MYEFQVDSCGLEEMNFEQLIAVFLTRRRMEFNFKE